MFWVMWCRDYLKKLAHSLNVLLCAERFVQSRHVFFFTRLLCWPTTYQVAKTLYCFGDECESTVCLRVLQASDILHILTHSLYISQGFERKCYLGCGFMCKLKTCINRFVIIYFTILISTYSPHTYHSYITSHIYMQFTKLQACDVKLRCHLGSD